MYGGVLPITGGFGLMAFGHAVGLDWLVGGSIGLVAVGITLYRAGSRLKGRQSVAS